MIAQVVQNFHDLHIDKNHENSYINRPQQVLQSLRQFSCLLGENYLMVYSRCLLTISITNHYFESLLPTQLRSRCKEQQKKPTNFLYENDLQIGSIKFKMFNQKGNLLFHHTGPAIATAWRPRSPLAWIWRCCQRRAAHPGRLQSCDRNSRLKKLLGLKMPIKKKKKNAGMHNIKRYTTRPWTSATNPFLAWKKASGGDFWRFLAPSVVRNQQISTRSPKSNQHM